MKFIYEKKIKKAISLCFILLSMTAFSQGKKITGTITSNDGSIMPGVSILEKGTNNGTQSDVDGKFSLVLKNDKATLIASFLGFQSYQEAVGNNNTINIVLKDDMQSLNEVVVVGYGKQKRASITGAVSTITSEKITIAPLANVSSALAGRLPGLITKQENGMPGFDTSSLSIRGFGDALIIVDGIQADINNLASTDIQSITILKDASAAVYGARAGNGVILVTTKRGASGKTSITLNATNSFSGPTNMRKMASSGQIAELSRETNLNKGLPESSNSYTLEQQALYYAGTNPDYPNTDWYHRVFRENAPMTQYDLSVRGGTDKVKFYGSLDYLNQQTIIKENAGAYDRFNLRSNVDAQITDNLSAQIDISNIWTKTDLPWRMYGGSTSAMFQEYWNTSPMFNPTNPDGSLAYGGAGASVSIASLTNKAAAGYDLNIGQNLTSSLALNYDFKSIKGLKARAFVNINQGQDMNKYWRFLPSSYTYNFTNNSYTQNTIQSLPDLKYTYNSNRTLTGQYSLNYSRTFAEDHEVSALALYEAIDYRTDWISAGRSNYTSTAIQYLFNGGQAGQTSDGSATEMGRQSLVFRTNYAYKSKYLLEATMRVDESAKFIESTRRGYFPSVSVGWRISKEDFLKDSNAIHDLKLRLSYSETGQDNVGSFKFLSGFKSGDIYLNGGSAANGMTTTGLANPLLTWETMKIYNGGIDFALLKTPRKLYGEFDIFWRDRAGIPGLQSTSIPDTFGASLPTLNLNSSNTRGFEFSLATEGNINDFKYNVSGNVSYSRSKWDHYDEPIYTDLDLGRQSIRSGQWTDRTFGYISQGLFTSQAEIDALTYVYDKTKGNISLKPGDIKFKDVNEDGLLDYKDKVEIGSGSKPNWMAGLNLDCSYKGFDLSALLQGGFGFTQSITPSWGSYPSTFFYDNRWTAANNNANALIPRLGGAGTNGSASDFYNRNSDYVRLKTLSIGYNLPKSLLNQINVQTLRIYFAGTNLLTFSDIMKYDVDPEAPSGQGGYYYPQMKTISFGLNVSL